MAAFAGDRVLESAFPPESGRQALAQCTVAPPPQSPLLAAGLLALESRLVGTGRLSRIPYLLVMDTVKRALQLKVPPECTMPKTPVCLKLTPSSG